MPQKVAERPHAITIALSLLGAGIAASGIYINYYKGSLPKSPTSSMIAVPDGTASQRPTTARESPQPNTGESEIRPEQELQPRKSTAPSPQEAPDPLAPLEQAAVREAEKDILGTWKCSNSDEQTYFADHRVHESAPWFVADADWKYRFLDTRHMELTMTYMGHTAVNGPVVRYEVTVTGPNQALRSENGGVTCTRK